MSQKEPIQNKAVFFLRVNPKGVSEKSADVDMVVGEIGAKPLDAYRSLLAEMYLPLLAEQSNWGHSQPEETAHFLQVFNTPFQDGIRVFPRWKMCFQDGKGVFGMENVFFFSGRKMGFQVFRKCFSFYIFKGGLVSFGEMYGMCMVRLLPRPYSGWERSLRLHASSRVSCDRP